LTRKRIALAQIRPVLGNVGKNLEKHLEWIGRAKAERADLVVFPELSLTGYQVQDLTLNVARKCTDSEIQTLILEASEGIDVVFSFVEEAENHLFFATSVYASEQKIRSVHRKVYLPTYGMFDEGRYFAAGEQFRAFPALDGQAGMLICEDAWHVSSPYLLSMDGADIIIIPAASPLRSVTDQEQFGSEAFWSDLLGVYARVFGVYVVFVNRVGFEDGIGFFGGSQVFSPDGQAIIKAEQLEEELCVGDIDLEVIRRSRYTMPILRDEKKHVVANELQRIMAKAGGNS
jgi:predicted amidohydrolase